MVNQSFSSQCESSTHDSDIRPLSFVQRDRVTGDEAPITDILPPGSVTSNEVLPLIDAVNDSRVKAIFTKPVELRNRNRATFQLKFNQGPGTPTVVQVPTITAHEGGSEGVNYQSAEWGFATADTHADVTPATLQMPAPPAIGATYLTGIKVTIDTPFAGAGLASLLANIQTPSGGILLPDINLMAAGTTVFETPASFSFFCIAQPLVWHIVATGANLDSLSAGEFTIELTFEDRNPRNDSSSPSDDWISTTGEFTKNVLIPYPTGIILTGRLVRFTATVIKAFTGPEGETYSMTPFYNTTPLLAPFAPTSVGASFDSGPISIPVSLPPGSTPFNATLTSSVFSLDSLDAGGVIQWDYFFEIDGPITPFAWSLGDTMTIVAFASLDDIQYTPISMARHDWSNTPFVDIIKFELFNIPDDFDPGSPPAPPSFQLCDIDHIAFKNTIMLFLTDFDNASTWNYIRFFVQWNPLRNEGDEIESSNGNASLEILTNAREL